MAVSRFLLAFRREGTKVLPSRPRTLTINQFIRFVSEALIRFQKSDLIIAATRVKSVALT